MTLGGKLGKGQRVYDYYASLIDSGKLKPGDRLPTYPQLEEQHGVSHATALAAIRALKADRYVRTSTAGMSVDLAGNARLYQALCDALNALEDADQQLQVEEFAGLACIAGRDGGACWNPTTQRWEAPAR